LMVDLVSNVGESAGFEVYATNNAADFQKAWVKFNPSVIVMDLVMPEMDGIALLTWLSEQSCSAPIILMSGYDGKYLAMAEHLGTAKGGTIMGTLAKPFKIDELKAMLKETLTLSG